jgi:hypothetical protein
MIRIHAETNAEADAAWNMAAGAQMPCEVYLDDVLLAKVERDPISRRLKLRRSAAGQPSAPHTAQPVHSHWR